MGGVTCTLQRGLKSQLLSFLQKKKRRTLHEEVVVYLSCSLTQFSPRTLFWTSLAFTELSRNFSTSLTGFALHTSM